MPAGADWHRQLLEQLSVEIPTVRQGLLSEQILFDLDEFRRFRHVVRSNYAYNLKSDQVIRLSEKLSACSQNLVQDIQTFIHIAGCSQPPAKGNHGG